MNEPTHASFFSGAGGLDLGLERAGWRTVSFSEIDPYASAVLAQRWPGVPNLGDITNVAQSTESRWHRTEWRRADLWSGGFPCQDLSVAGKRRGLAGSRSGLAFSFLDLVGRHRPRFVLLENVPGLLSSHGGKDFGTLLATLVELGYGVGYRVLDARYFGVPQRRRRVFILGDSTGGRVGAERAAEVLSVGSRCHRHPPTGIEAGPGAASQFDGGADLVGTVPAGLGHHGHAGTSSQAVAAGHVVVDVATRDGLARSLTQRTQQYDDDTATFLVAPTLTGSQERLEHPGDQAYAVERSSPDPRGMRAPDGLARRSHDRDGVANAVSASAGHHGHGSPRGDGGDNLVTVFTKGKLARADSDDETWDDRGVMPTLNAFDVGDVRTTAAILGAGPSDDPLLPLRLDSHRYRCCGNGVVADVGEWIGQRLLASLEDVA